MRKLDQKDTIEIDPQIRQMVTFVRCNLADDDELAMVANTSAVDIILCRNVLMYFTPEVQRAVVAQLQRALVAGGWLVVGAVEASAELLRPLVPVTFPGAILFPQDGDSLTPTLSQYGSARNMQERRFTPSPLAGEGWDGGERPGRWVPPGGILTLRVAGGALDTGAPAVVIEFADTGLGIAPEHLPKVMEPFFTTKAAGKDTGLGLAICRRIVQEHHGTFTLASEVGTGTTVRIALPLMNATIEP